MFGAEEIESMPQGLHCFKDDYSCKLPADYVNLLTCTFGNKDGRSPLPLVCQRQNQIDSSIHGRGCE